MEASDRNRTSRVVQAALAALLLAGLTACGGGAAAPTPSVVSTARQTTSTSSSSTVPATTTQPPTTTEPPSTTTEPQTPSRLPARLRGVEWTLLPTTRRLVALTFDAGSNADGLLSIMATLHDQGVTHATFFLTGDWVDSYPGLARRVAARFSLGNHTITHPHLPTLDDHQIVHEVRGARRTIVAATGVDTRPLFRFPYGEGSPHALRIVNDLGFASIRWTLDTLGWEGASAGITTDSILHRILEGCSPARSSSCTSARHPTTHRETPTRSHN